MGILEASRVSLRVCTPLWKDSSMGGMILWTLDRSSFLEAMVADVLVVVVLAEWRGWF